MQMVGDLLDGQDLRLMSVLMCGALATVPSQKHIAFITTTLYAAKDWMLRHPKFCEWLLQASTLPQAAPPRHLQMRHFYFSLLCIPLSMLAGRCSVSLWLRQWGQTGHQKDSL